MANYNVYRGLRGRSECGTEFHISFGCLKGAQDYVAELEAKYDGYFYEIIKAGESQ